MSAAALCLEELLAYGQTSLNVLGTHRCHHHRIVTYSQKPHPQCRWPSPSTTPFSSVTRFSKSLRSRHAAAARDAVIQFPPLERNSSTQQAGPRTKAAPTIPRSWRLRDCTTCWQAADLAHQSPPHNPCAIPNTDLFCSPFRIICSIPAFSLEQRRLHLLWRLRLRHWLRPCYHSMVGCA